MEGYMREEDGEMWYWGVSKELYCEFLYNNFLMRVEMVRSSFSTHICKHSH
jgi:hypothetical protein